MTHTLVLWHAALKYRAYSIIGQSGSARCLHHYWLGLWRLCLLSLFGLTPLHAGQIKMWTDDCGITTFGDAPPPEVSAEVISSSNTTAFDQLTRKRLNTMTREARKLWQQQKIMRNERAREWLRSERTRQALAEARKQKTIVPGMSSNDALAIWGLPESTRKTQQAGKVREQWTYRRMQPNAQKMLIEQVSYLHLENGKVTAIR